MRNQKFTFIDLFSGVGGFRIPLEQLGGKCVAYSEIDKQAIKVYENNFDTNNETYLKEKHENKNTINKKLF